MNVSVALLPAKSDAIKVADAPVTFPSVPKSSATTLIPSTVVRVGLVMIALSDDPCSLASKSLVSIVSIGSIIRSNIGSSKNSNVARDGVLLPLSIFPSKTANTFPGGIKATPRLS